MDVAAAQQLRALRAEQAAACASVATHIGVLAHAREALHTAQQEEAALTKRLHAASRRTQQLSHIHEAAEEKLRDAAEQLAETQALCHHLESQLAGYVRCQRAAVVLPAPVSSLAGPLCWLDPYSLLHAPSGLVVSFDGVVTQVDEGEESEEGACAGVDVTLTSLLSGVAHDLLQGFPCTLLHTTSEDGTEREKKNSSSSSSDSGTAPSLSSPSSSMSAHQLCRCVLQRVLDEAGRCGTQALAVSLAVGRVAAAPSSASSFVDPTTTTTTNNFTSTNSAAAPPLEDVLGSVLAQYRDTTALEDIVPVLMDAAGCEGGAAAVFNNNEHDQQWESTAASPFTPINAHALHTKVPQHAPRPTVTTTLTGVPVRSLDELDLWLARSQLVMREAEEKTRGDAKEATTSTSEFRHDCAPASSPAVVVVLLGVVSQDAAGTIHKALLRLVHDNTFQPHRSAATTSRSSSLTSPQQHRTSSLLYEVMRAAVMAVALQSVRDDNNNSTCDTAVSGTRLLPSSEPEKRCSLRAGEELEALTRQLLAEPYMGISAAATRHAVESAFRNCPAELARQRCAREEWALWAALLRPVFGGNSKALWLHTLSAASGGVGADETAAAAVAAPRRPDNGAVSSSFLSESALTLCALFCRLVRHDAVAWAVPADLDRLLRHPH